MITFDKKSVSQRIKFFRTSILLTSQEKISSDLGIAQSTWHYYETGRSDLTGRTLTEMIVNYGLSPRWMYFGEGSPVPSDLQDVLQSAINRLEAQ